MLRKTVKEFHMRRKPSDAEAAAGNDVGDGTQIQAVDELPVDDAVGLNVDRQHVERVAGEWQPGLADGRERRLPKLDDLFRVIVVHVGALFETPVGERRQRRSIVRPFANGLQEFVEHHAR